MRNEMGMGKSQPRSEKQSCKPGKTVVCQEKEAEMLGKAMRKVGRAGNATSCEGTKSMRSYLGMLECRGGGTAP